MGPIPAVATNRLVAHDLVGTTLPNELLYFLVNVGDGDAQVLLLPAATNAERRAIVVDVKNEAKASALLASLEDEGLLSTAPGRLPLVVATHPHDDHIGGMPQFLLAHDDDIGELWEPGFLGTIGEYHEMMVALEDRMIPRRRPTAGHVAVFDNVRVTVLTPGLRLRHQFITHGVNENNASIALRVEWPASRVVKGGSQRMLRDYVRPRSLVLGADAQTEAWSHAVVDFPQMRTSGEAARRAMQALVGPDLLSADIFKIPHHASKHGLSLELAERVAAEVSVVSCVNGAGRHNFPHELARAILRSVAGESLADVPSDDELGVHYTGASDDGGNPLGTICTRLSRIGLPEVFRFGDGQHDEVDLTAARHYTP